MKTIRKKLTTSYIILAIVCIAGTFALIANQFIGTLGGQMQEQHDALVVQLAEGLDDYNVTDTEKIQQYINRTMEHQKSITFIDVIDKNNKIIASSDKLKVGKEGDSKVKRVLDNGKTVSETTETHDDSEVFQIIAPVQGNSFGEGALSAGLSIHIDAKGIVINALKFIIGMLILAIIIAYVVSTKISKPIKVITKKMEEVADGNFSAKFEINTKDEISILADTMNKTMIIINNMISNIKGSADDLNNVSQILSSSTYQVAASSDGVTKAIEEVAIGASNQSGSISETVNLLEGFGKNLDEVNKNLMSVSEESNKIKNAADLGSDKIELLVKSIEDVSNTFKYVVEKLTLLDDSVGKITTITDVINNVAEQTNLLALNAAIEAARAGEVGRGFSVVAEEIRKLAEQVLDSSKGIAQLVNNITIETKDVSKTAQAVSSKMLSQSEDVQEAVISFKHIIMEVDNIAPQIDIVNNTLNTAIKSKNEVVKKVSNVALVSEEVSAAAEEITSSVEEQNTSIEELTKTAKDLTEMSAKMLKGIEVFKI